MGTYKLPARSITRGLGLLERIHIVTSLTTEATQKKVELESDVRMRTTMKFVYGHCYVPRAYP